MSTATLPKVGTPPPANGIDLATEVTNIAAPKHAGDNLFIRIDVGSQKAKFYCLNRQEVPGRTERHVFFRANEHCWLMFDRPSVFVEPYLELVKDEEISAHIADTTKKVETGFVVRIEAPKMMKRAAKMPNAEPDTLLRPPVIVVP
jgi:hypothetical protein